MNSQRDESTAQRVSDVEISFDFLSALIGEVVVAGDIDNINRKVKLRLRHSAPEGTPHQIVDLNSIFVSASSFGSTPIFIFKRDTKE